MRALAALIKTNLNWCMLCVNYVIYRTGSGPADERSPRMQNDGNQRQHRLPRPIIKSEQSAALMMMLNTLNIIIVYRTATIFFIRPLNIRGQRLLHRRRAFGSRATATEQTRIGIVVNNLSLSAANRSPSPRMQIVERSHARAERAAEESINAKWKGRINGSDK